MISSIHFSMPGTPVHTIRIYQARASSSPVELSRMFMRASHLIAGNRLGKTCVINILCDITPPKRSESCHSSFMYSTASSIVPYLNVTSYYCDFTRVFSRAYRVWRNLNSSEYVLRTCDWTAFAAEIRVCGGWSAL